MQEKKPFLGSILLLITALIWGLAFVFQSTAMDRIGPLTLTSVRMLCGGAALIPLCALFCKDRSREELRQSIRGGILCGSVLCIASLLQQYGIAGTTVGKAGFISALYIVIVPLLGLFFGRRPKRRDWIGVAVAMLGFFLLSFSGAEGISAGDALVFVSSVCYSAHILVIDRCNRENCDGLIMACVQFLTAGILSFVPMLLAEHPSGAALASAWKELLYMSLMSCGVAYTLQIFGQRCTPPTAATLMMSLESVFAALSGWIILGQRLTGRELLGCALVFSAVLLTQLKKQNTE